jgi:hypothetical protein
MILSNVDSSLTLKTDLQLSGNQWFRESSGSATLCRHRGVSDSSRTGGGQEESIELGAGYFENVGEENGSAWPKHARIILCN